MSLATEETREAVATYGHLASTIKLQPAVVMVRHGRYVVVRTQRR
jgi:hypothetical protein